MSNLKNLAKELKNKQYLNENVRPILEPMMKEIVNSKPHNVVSHFSPQISFMISYLQDLQKP